MAKRRRKRLHLVTLSPRERALLLEVVAGVGAGQITETSLAGEMDEDMRVYGYCWTPGGEVDIDPAPSVMPILLHELVHRMRPDWTELAVQRAASRLMRSLSNTEIQAIFSVYEGVRQRGRKKA